MASRKRKTPLAASTDADRNAIVAPVSKKNKTATAKLAKDAAATAAKNKYSDPGSFTNLEPAKLVFIEWPASEDDDNDNGDDGDPEDEDIPAGSLQYILNELANECYKAVHEALNPPEELKDGCRIINMGEARQRIDEASKPYQEKMEEARKKFVAAGTITEEEAKAVVGQDDQRRKEKRKAKRELQNALNEVQKDMNKAVEEAVKPFQEKIKKIRDAFQEYRELTAEETMAIVPNIEDAANGGKTGEKGDGKNAGEKKDFVAPRVVTDEGYPVTRAGFNKFVEINQEVEKRDPDAHGMYIYNDFAGYGVVEVLENTLAQFNKLIFKKNVSPLEKWAIVEGLSIYLALGNHMALMMNENSEGTGEVFNALGVMFTTALEMLHESCLISLESPLPDNIGVMTLLFLDFMANTASDFDLDWTDDVVRAADGFGVVLEPVEKIKGVDQEMLDELRKRGKKFANWKTAYPKFKKGHPGSSCEYDITQMSKAEKAQYTFGTKEHDARMREMMGEDSDEVSGEDPDSYSDSD
ncbi:hypothetical protein G7Y89_g14087 [Cudoniella acicularis]|uniref:Uncharacterized protein n=1 Tax=Cudoniella acicularis TaxID=354080 RepID=A0A8H4VVU1_9HELO|nr:hypothetical protein G7Y89_g14087 [Cudoniella acicularis]